jgi:hypothetical protein
MHWRTYGLFNKAEAEQERWIVLSRDYLRRHCLGWQSVARRSSSQLRLLRLRSSTVYSTRRSSATPIGEAAFLGGPYAIVLADRRLMALAGVWENWRSPAGEWVRSFAIITTTPNNLCAELQNRMPAKPLWEQHLLDLPLLGVMLDLDPQPAGNRRQQRGELRYLVLCEQADLQIQFGTGV